MIEQKSRTPVPAKPAETTSSTWNLPAVGESLRTQPRPLTDRLAGSGQAFHLAVDVALTLFPERRLLRFSSPLAELTLAPVTNVEPQADRLRVESSDAQHKATALFDPKGGLIFTLQPNDATSGLEPAIVEASIEQPENSPVPTPSPETEAPAAEATPDAGEAAKTTTTTEDERGERLVFTGRVGRVPELKTTAKGHRLVRIPLAVHEGEETSWHTIVFFDDLAERAVTTLAKGELVSVVGYKHVREIQTKRGTKEQELIFAAALQGAKKQSTS